MATTTVISPSGPAAEFYATQVEVAALGDGLAAQIVAEIDGERRKHGMLPVLRDGRLDHVARDVARIVHGCRAPDPDAVIFLLWHYGVVEPEPNLFIHCGEEGAEGAALGDFRRQLAASRGLSNWRRVGIGVERAAGHWNAVILFQEKNLDIEPLPRQLAAGAHATLRFRVRAPFRKPEVLVTPPRGSVSRQEAAAHHDGHAAQLSCDRGDGAYQVEINAQDAGGPRVLANFPIYCGVAPPAELSAVTAGPAAAPDPEAFERQLIDLMDRDRQQAGLPPFVRDARLATVARRYSREMAETGQVAHISARSGSVVDRLQKSGLAPPPTAVMENVAAATSAKDAERAFMGSPGHRDNILSPLVTHVGVGVAVGRDQGATPVFYVTQIFAGWQK